jgi:LysM repeat protein
MQWKDAEESVKPKEEEPEAFYEEEYSPLGVKAGGTSAASRRFGNPIVWIPAIVVVIIVVYIFLPVGSNTQDKAQLSGFDARLDQLDKRMLKLESVGERVLNLEKSLKENETLEKRLDRLEASLARRMDQVDKELLQLRKDLEAQKIKKSTTPPPANQKKATTDPAMQHVVKKGDTLYSISRRYGITVEQLRKINSLDKNSVIVVGQKLNVK